MDKIRCPACRGSKKVAKLGGMLGDCNTCKGEGNINASDKPAPIVASVEHLDSAIISRVADCVPTTTLELKTPVEEDIKVDPKKAIYKRKTNS